MRFIEAKERSGPRKPDAEARVELTGEMIRETGAQFGVDLKDAQDLLAMRETMSRNTFADWVNACGYLQIVQNALTKGTYEDRTSGLWKQALVRRTKKQKRRFTGFLNKIALKDSTFRHLSILTSDERKKMAMAFLQASLPVAVGERSDPWLAIRCASMYFYIDGMWTRAEDPRNRTLSDLHAFEYPPSGRTGASRSVMECIYASKDSGKTTSPTGHWEVQTYTHHKEWLLCPIFWLALWMVVKYESPGWKDIVPFPDVLAGREQGYGLQRVYCNAKTPHKSISPAAHGYSTEQARKRANRTSFKNTYEGRPTAW
ncbi:TPA: hypothetical protein ACH3X1_015779 [Trebouxia sp. C0004]